MTKFVKTTFAAVSSPGQERKERGTLVVFADPDLRLGGATAELMGPAAELIAKSAAVAKFKGKNGTAVTVLAPADLDFDRLIVIGTGPAKDFAGLDFVTLGGAVMGKLPQGATATVLFDFAETLENPAAAAADFALGLHLRGYRFDLYKTTKKDDGESKGPAHVTIGVADPAAARRAYKSRQAIAEGVDLARDLVNEPPNVLNPEEFARRAEKLQEIGVEVDILDEKAMRKLGMRALLGVGQGSHYESRVAIMRWHGGGAKDKPIAFIGKGVCFDTGGISIKPAAGMEDMKGDMAGAACVTGLMHTLAMRKAKVNAIGAIGIVENMPDGKAQRPGDIVTSMSGQTIEIINTDAEGRLVLADVLWYVQDKFKPEFMIDLATLTGAILVALGQEHAGLFSNNDLLAERLAAAGKATGEAVWRMPLGAAYDKLIDSKFADMKNTGGRFGGSITAAQFLQRFVNDTPWAHLDIAGSGMNSLANDVNQSWGSGWGVRLLNRLVADHYEK
ncbi:leucyl aminopeptidase [Methylovirgula sp. 4M-Z18]|uniref:leucyl aminopeptidase n=1 Tax=Methylovirgula sp. 4M-Z18 TaxID=2293567 RepID=UPI000E2EF1EA|nr:leucyl aminopeptidase [Methylovirgula sp. 4M-Z18]RFB81006.1 leucyl aminopeptidase [Methylovirgula sp. 4M-Z18]